MNPLRININSYLQSEHWDFGNNFLYKMCKKNFAHKNDGVIITKVLFIGRIYAAAIERRKKETKLLNGDFYIKKVAPTFKNSNLDNNLSKLKKIKTVTLENISEILGAHFQLMKTIRKITKLDKRSFCSKYLHFHLPELFFIYDSRVQSSIRKMEVVVPKEFRGIASSKHVDTEYAKFYCKSLHLKKELEKMNKLKLNNRHIDNLLIDLSNKKH